jgi:hypothetical protein
MAYPFRPIKKGQRKILRIEPRLHDPRDKAMPMAKAIRPHQPLKRRILKESRIRIIKP